MSSRIYTFFDNTYQRFLLRAHPARPKMLETENIECDFAVFDDSFPSRIPFGFRNVEINHLINSIPNAKAFNNYYILPGKEAWFTHGYGRTEESYLDNLQGYLTFFPENAGKIDYLHPNKKYNIKLAYCIFLCYTYCLLPFLERNKVPFVFTLYPGGGFGLDNPSSDNMLQRVFSSKYFRRVITTQTITRDYLLKQGLCPSEKISFLYGSYIQLSQVREEEKPLYKRDKDTFDICFVACKYTPKGVDKGYDLVIEAAHILSQKHPDIRFHIVGGFDENEIDVEDIRLIAEKKTRLLFTGIVWLISCRIFIQKWISVSLRTARTNYIQGTLTVFLWARRRCRAASPCSQLTNCT
jgi:glycosyltransferase involved in cell wall biosynthesis